MALSPPRWRSPYTVAAVCRAGVQASSLLGMLLAVAVLDPATFGPFSVAWVTAVIANTLVYSGFYEFLLRVRDVDHAKHSVFWMLLAQGAASALVMVGAGVLADTHGSAATARCFLALAPVPLLTACSAWCDGLLTRHGHAATVGAAFFVAELLGALGVSTGLSLGWGATALLAWRLGTTTLALLGLALFTGGFPRACASRSVAREALRTALPIQGGTLVGSLSSYAADLLLAWHFSPATSASYRASARVCVAGNDVFLQPLRPMTWAAMARRERADDRAGIGRVYLDQLRMISFFAWPTLFCVAVFSKRLFAAVSTRDWSEAGPILFLLALARIPAVFQFFLGPVMVCHGRAAQLWRLQTALTCICLFAIAAMSLFGPLAVAACELLLGISGALYAAVCISRVAEVDPREVVRAVVPAVLVALLCAGVGELAFRALTLIEPARLLVSVGAMGACLLACYAALRRRLSIHLPEG
ncbi:MAG: oligosaccharide flippase family protein [Polyangiales bacterium]